MHEGEPQHDIPAELRETREVLAEGSFVLEPDMNDPVPLNALGRAVEEAAGRLRQELALEDTDENWMAELSFYELLINAVKHGNGMDFTKPVTVSWQRRADGYDVSITDTGPGFDPSALPDPNTEENIKKFNGRGVKDYAEQAFDVVRYERGESGFTVHLRKKWKDSLSHESRVYDKRP